MVEAASSSDRVVAGRYRILRELGRGGMGVVWLAVDELIGRQVALKEQRVPEGSVAAEWAAFAQRALAEARNAARIRHPNAVALYDVIPASAQDDAVYLVMEPVEAESLDKIILTEGRLPQERVAAIALQLLDVLDAAHALDVVHRDVKPANILLAPGDVVKLTDFGIAHNAADPRLTGDGLIVGTPAYMAPEAYQNGPITPAADQWSLGASLFHAAEGANPFQRDTTAEVLAAILFEDIPKPTCGRPLADAISALLIRDPERRATSERVRALLATVAPAVPSASPVPVPAPGYPTLLKTRIEDRSILLGPSLTRGVNHSSRPNRGSGKKAAAPLGALAGVAALIMALILITTHGSQSSNVLAVTTVDTFASSASDTADTSAPATTDATTTVATSPRTLATGPHFLVNGDSNGCLDQDYSDGTAHPDVLSYPCNYDSNESWDVRLDSDGSYSLVNAATGECLNQDYSDGTAHDDVIAYQCGANANQDWQAIGIDGRTFLQNKQSGGCLDQDYSSGTPALDVLAYSPCNYAANEAWTEQ